MKEKLQVVSTCKEGETSDEPKKVMKKKPLSRYQKAISRTVTSKMHKRQSAVNEITRRARKINNRYHLNQPVKRM